MIKSILSQSCDPASPLRPRKRKSPSKTGFGIEVRGVGMANREKPMRIWARIPETLEKVV